MRILRDKSPNKYMAVMRFRRQSYADQFYEEYNGKPYSSLSLGDVPERCHLAFVQRVDFIDSKSKQGTEPLQSLFPNFSGSYKEIPTCPVCLERLDSSSSGLLTILCEHTFHCNCLARWKEDNVCPICRYLQQPTNNGSVCSKCGIQDDLWICLLCGHIGCSRYRESHARAHYLQTFHNYALEVETQRVWDYAGDGYVHRLITNKTDGKLVELPSSRSNSDARSSCDPDVKESALEKAEAASIEYQYLLVAQLETQRIYYEEQFEKLKKVGDEQTADLRKHLEKLQEENRRLVQKNKQLESEKLKIIEREQSLAEKVKEQTEYLHDLTMYIEAQKVLRDQGEFVDGQVFVLSNSGSLTSKKSSSSLSTAGQSARRRPKRS
ncbi:uncharacterized protein LOC126329068 [Schistocerca gregaria]|uniref:uncharacterized protein LOC126329068 n=1 Tax=Schistocerca gregaria TaxID=7010 RepID=UPI00211DE403|nr:uncharacterized protein LOC126329068 [Schistocerca gregaria]